MLAKKEWIILNNENVFVTYKYNSIINNTLFIAHGPLIAPFIKGFKLILHKWTFQWLS